MIFRRASLIRFFENHPTLHRNKQTTKMSFGRKKLSTAEDFVDIEAPTQQLNRGGEAKSSSSESMGLVHSKTASTKKKVGVANSRRGIALSGGGDSSTLGGLPRSREFSSSQSSSARSIHVDDELDDDDANDHREGDVDAAIEDDCDDSGKKKKNTKIVSPHASTPTTTTSTTTTNNNRPVGIRNLGNTCYMNSALQCLMATDPLTQYFRSGLYMDELNVENPLGAQGKLAVEYGKLLDELSSSSPGLNNRTVLTPRTFKAKLDAFAPQFRGHRQHDAQELLAFLLDGIHEDLNRIKTKPYIEDKDCDGTNDEADAVLAWQNYLKRDKSPIVDIFQGQLRSELRCQTCRHGNVRFEPFMYLSLPIVNADSGSNKKTTLSDCLQAYLQEETLTGDNQWYCSKCQTHVDATKKTDLWIVPPILIIHLKRFKQQHQPHGLLGKVVTAAVSTGGGAATSGSCKNSAMVHFDEYWNCTEFCAGGAGAPQQPASPRSSPRHPPPVPKHNSHHHLHHEYDLYGVSHHHGRTLGGGHYTASVRRDQRWYHCNDQTVQMVDDDDDIATHHSSNNNDASSAYLLFYQRRSNSLGVRRQSESRPDLWPHANSQRRVTTTPASPQPQHKLL
jgi:ubiquitin carboxyl-terminal hydrolase 8